jgi:tetratricopeptide (TPR) repeat protein
MVGEVMVGEVNERLAAISNNARRAAHAQNWQAVHQGAQQLIDLAPGNPEGHFLFGLVEKASNHPRLALAAFETALKIDSGRYDAAIELANQYTIAARNTEAISLLNEYEARLDNSPRYLDMAGTIYSTLGMAEKAWPLYEKANQLQPDVDLFKGNIASSAVYLGKLSEAEKIYRALLAKHPTHQRNHYHLSRLRTATSDEHIQEMLAVLDKTALPPGQNVFLYYALGKEFEDLERWDEAFGFYKKGADAISGVANYNADEDLHLISEIMSCCTHDWFKKAGSKEHHDKTPIFVLGLPRTGSTLIERIISSHSQVKSIGETQYFETVLRTASDVESIERMNTDMIRALKDKDLSLVAKNYLAAIEYQLEDEPCFLEKLPYNFLYIGFIAKAFPDAKIVYVQRNPLDACFAMYKQVFTWAYKFSYSLEHLAEYYVAHSKLLDHWQSLLGERLVTVEYESMIQDQESETRHLLDLLQLPFEDQCLNFEANQAASATASSVQVREKIHARSVAKWVHFEAHLEPLRTRLLAEGIEC